METVDDRLAKLDGKIDETEKEIQDCCRDIKAVEGDIKAAETAGNVKKEEQLRKKEEQLRKKEEQLRDEKRVYLEQQKEVQTGSLSKLWSFRFSVNKTSSTKLLLNPLEIICKLVQNQQPRAQPSPDQTLSDAKLVWGAKVGCLQTLKKCIQCCAIYY